MKVNFENAELDLLVEDEEVKELIVQALILYPVSWDVVKDMICLGLKGYQIKEMCDMWYKKGQSIEEMWRGAKTVLTINSKSNALIGEEDIKALEEELHRLGTEKFEKEMKIESIEHQLQMSLYRYENGEEVDHLWVNKAKFKLNMLKIELKKINLNFDKYKKDVGAYYKAERKKEKDKHNLRLERVFMNFIKEDYGDEMFFYYVDKAKEYLKYIDGERFEDKQCEV